MDIEKPDTKVSDMTVADLEKFVRQIVKEELKAVYEYIFELEEQMPDPDEGKTLKAEFMAGLEEGQNIPLSERRGIPWEQVKRELGLDE